MSSSIKSVTEMSVQEKRALLAELVRRKAEQPKSYPVSFAQERLWFLQQLAPGSSFYNLPFAIRLQGRLDRNAFKEALAEITRRHSVLRTSFASKDGSPMQVVHGRLELPVSFVDLRELPADMRETEAHRLVNEKSLQTFDLERPPLWGAWLFQLDADEHLLLVCIHHIISDGWSSGVLVRELSALYEAFSLGMGSPLAELPIQYVDYAVWQREWLDGERLEKQLDYWRQQLSGAPDLLELPTDRPRPAVQNFRGANLPFKLPETLSAALATLGRREGVTMFVTLLAAFKILLARYTGQDDISVGTPIAGRDRLETEQLVGLFINTLVLRTHLSDNPTFRETLARVRDVVFGAHAHQDVPFEKLVEALQPQRSLSHTPLFQVAFAFTGNSSGSTLELPGLVISDFGTKNQSAKFDLTLNVEQTENALVGSFEYNTDLFDADTIRRMLRHFETLLEGIVADPQQRVHELPLLTPTELHELLVARNQTAKDYPFDKCLQQFIEEQVARTPAAVAVVFGNERLTYSELNERANQLAHFLRAQGVSQDSRVSVLMHRSLEMVVALLATLKAGGAYLPLDPGYPSERLSFMLSDGNIQVLLTQQDLRDTLAVLGDDNASAVGSSERTSERTTVCLDSEWAQIAAFSTANPAVTVEPENLAYVIYTSGSTGRPKGAMNSHAAIVNRLLWMQDEYQLTDADTVLQKTPFSFDVSVWEFFWPLMVGARLVVAQPGGHQDSAYLRDLIRQEQVTTLHFVPSMLGVFLQEQEIEACTSIKRVICSGEALPKELTDRFFSRLGTTGAGLHNLYGPTEAAIDVSYWECEANSERMSVPIGHPISNIMLYILDAEMRAVPVGVGGELYIGGIGLARGYWNRAELTAERFVPHPYAEQAGERLYRTGDVARFAADGAIEYLGRIDHQVKVRGFRIELGEIEAALAAHEAVREAVVVAFGKGEEKRLSAYVVADDGQALDVGELRGYLRGKLPEYMVPGSFVVMDALPLTPNGKVDRKALPEPTGERQNIKGTFVQPGYLMELKLTQIWEDLLNVRPIGVTDNFFDLGGHSLLTVRLMAQIEKVFGTQLPLTILFQHGTIRELAKILVERTEEPEWSHIVPIQPHGSRRPFFCVHSLGGQVAGLYLLSRYLGIEHPFYGIQARFLHEKEVGDKVTPIEETAARYLEAMRSVQPEGPYMVGGYSFGGIIAYEIAVQLETAGEEVALLSMFDSHSPSFLRKLPADNDTELLIKLAWVTSRQHNKELLLPLEELQRLEPEEQLEFFMREMRKLDLLPIEAEVDFLRNFLRGMTSRRKALRLYTPRSYRGRITLLRCEEDDALMNQILTDAGLDAHDPALGWGELTSVPVDVRVVPGHHDRMMVEPYVEGVAHALRDCIDEAEKFNSPKRVN